MPIYKINYNLRPATQSNNTVQQPATDDIPIHQQYNNNNNNANKCNGSTTNPKQQQQQHENNNHSQSSTTQLLTALRRPTSKLQAGKEETIVEREIRIQLDKEKEIQTLRNAILYSPTTTSDNIDYNQQQQAAAAAAATTTTSSVNGNANPACSHLADTVSSCRKIFEGDQQHKRDHVELNKNEKETKIKYRSVQPFEDVNEDLESKLKFIQPQNETVIEKEVRLTRQREGSLRRARGDPLQIHQNEIKTNVEIPVLSLSIHGNATNYPRSPTDSHHSHSSNGTRNDQMNARRLATNRLKQEISKERQREVDLRKQGKIVTLSEERAALDASIIEELVTKELEERKKLESRKSESPLNDHYRSALNHYTHHPPSPVSKVPKDANVKSNSSSMKDGPGPQGSGKCPLYDNESMNAESRIEEEIKEIKRREQELREQRLVAGVEPPTSPTDANTQPTFVTSYRRRR